MVEAVNCAVEIQTTLKAENEGLPLERRMEFRIGVNSGDVMVEGEQIYGDGVNVAARLESLAQPGGICISRTVHDSIRNKLALDFADLGEQAVKNIAEPVHVWRLVLDGVTSQAEFVRPRRRYWRGGVLSLTGVAIVVATILVIQHVSFKPPRTHASIPPQTKPALPLSSIPSIAVLPFTNLSGDPQQEYFSDGISNQLIEDLSRLPGLLVIARNSSFAYKGKTVSEREIGARLGVKYVLEGTVRKSADQVRIGVALVDTTSGTEMWTTRYDRPLTAVFAVQDDIVRRVMTTLGLVLKTDQMNAPHWFAPSPTGNLEAFDDMLRAYQYLWRNTKDDNASCRQWAEKASKLDPTLPAPLTTVGWTYFFDAYFRWTDNPHTSIERSIGLGQKALLLDDSDCGALALLSNDYQYDGEFDRAVAEGKRAVTINPNCSIGYTFLATALSADGKPSEALTAVVQAMRLDPAGRDFYAGVMGKAYLVMGRYQEASVALKQHVAAYPNALWGHLDLAIAYTELGRDREAHAEAAEVMRINPGYVLPPREKGPDPTKDSTLNRRFDADLRKAGLK